MSSDTVEALRAGFCDPPRSTAPMMRWWWFGPSVDRAELDRELTAMAAGRSRRGGGRVRLSAQRRRARPSCRPSSWPTCAMPRTRAQALGLRFDLTLGSGWSFGGPHVTAEHAARRLRWERREISGGPLRLPVAAPWPGDELVAAYVGSGSLQEPPDDFRLLAIEDEVIEIPAGVGPRVVLLAYAQLTGQNVKRAALGRRRSGPRPLQRRRDRTAPPPCRRPPAGGCPRGTWSARCSATALRSTAATGLRTCPLSSPGGVATTCCPSCTG